MNHVQVVLYLQTPMLTKLFACAKPIKIIQTCKMPGKHKSSATFQKILDSLGSSIHSALVIRSQVEIMTICQGKIIVICNQQYQVYEACSSCFIFTNTNINKIICMCKTNQDNPNL